jgi:hypothetical protein
VTNVGRQALLGSVRARVRRLGRSLKPNEDWAPVAFLRGTEGAISLVELSGEHWTDLLLQSEATTNLEAVCVVTTAWIGFFDEQEQRRAQIDPEDVPRPSERADRTECVVLHAADRAGFTLEVAKITRDEHRPPTLAVFEPAPGEPLPSARIAEAFTRLLGPGWMGGPEQPEPISTDGLATLHEYLAGVGAYFDGNPFALFVPVAAPELKTVAVVTCEPWEFERSKGRPNRLAIEGLEVGSDIALRISLTLLPRGAPELQVAPVLNLTEEAARTMIADLAEREIWELVFLNCHEGAPIGTRYLPVDEDQLRSLRELLAVTDGREPLTLERWQAITAHLQAGFPAP